MALHWPCDCTAHSSILSIGSVPVVFCEAFTWTIFNSSRFPLFHRGQFFHELVCPLTVALPQIFFSVLISSFLLPFSCTSWCCCSLPWISHFLQVWIFSFSVLSFCRTDQEFLQWPRSFFSWRCLPRISPAVSVTTVLKVVIIEFTSVSSLFKMMRGANFPPIIAWKVSNTLGSSFWSTPGFKHGTSRSSWFLLDGILISSSAVSHCGVVFGRTRFFVSPPEFKSIVKVVWGRTWDLNHVQSSAPLHGLSHS